MNEDIVIITNGNYFSSLILRTVLRDRLSSIKGIVIVSGDYKARTGIHAVLGIARATSLPYFLYKLFVHLAFMICQRLWPRASFAVSTLAEQLGIPTLTVSSVNSFQCYDWIQQFKPALLVSVSCPQLIRQRILKVAPLGGINIHSSILPKYAGLAPYYWVLTGTETETGVSIHYMSRRFDTGHLLVQKRVPIASGISAFVLFYQLARIGASALSKGIEMALANFPGEAQKLGSYEYRSHPTFNSWFAVRRQGHRIIRFSELVRVIQDEIRLSRSAAVSPLKCAPTG